MPKPIKSKKEYEQSLKAVGGLMKKEPKKGSRQAEELELLTILIQAYERQYFPLSLTNPIAAIQFRMEQGNIAEAELTRILGGRSRKSEILLGKRKLSLEHDSRTSF